MQGKKLTGLKFRSIQLCPIGAARILHQMQAALLDHTGMTGRDTPPATSPSWLESTSTVIPMSESERSRMISAWGGR
jgi:hypothetical protein